MNGWKPVWPSLSASAMSLGLCICILEKSCTLVAVFSEIMTFSNHCFSPYFSPLQMKFLAHLTHPSKNWVAVIWLLVINHDQPFSIYRIPSCAGHSQFALQDGTQRDFRSAVQRCLVWKKNPNPNIPPCTFCEMFKGASLPPAQNT